MVRLVFRPYTQIRPSICTSERRRTSTRVSSGFILSRHSSPSFGSQHLCSDSNLSRDIKIGPWCPREGSHITLSLRARVCHSNTRTHVRLLGPCFKTGRLRPFRQRRVCCPRLVCTCHPAVCKQSTRRTHTVTTSSRHYHLQHTISQGAIRPNGYIPQVLSGTPKRP